MPLIVSLNFNAFECGKPSSIWPLHYTLGRSLSIEQMIQPGKDYHPFNYAEEIWAQDRVVNYIATVD